MNIEDRIKETLMSRSTDVEPKADSFEQVASTVRRRHSQRLAFVTTSVIALIAAAAVIVPRLGTDGGDNGFAVPGPGDPTPPAVDDDRVTVRDERFGFQARMPADWRLTEFEGAIELLPPGQIGLAAGEDTFGVEINLLDASAFDPGDQSGASVSQTTVGGQQATRSEMADEDGGSRIVRYAVAWPAEYCQPGWCEPGQDYTLLIHLIAQPADRWDQFGDDAEAIVESLEPTATASFPTGQVLTRRGLVSSDVAYDGATATLVRFLESRIAGGDAERHMTEDAAAATGDRLYGSGGDVWLGYRVTARDGAAFEVAMLNGLGDEPSGETERVEIADGVVTAVAVIGDLSA